MHALMSQELAEQRRRDLLRQAELARRARKAPATIAVIWSDRGIPPGDPPVPMRLPASRGSRSGNRS